MLKASGPQAGSPFSKGLPDRCPFCIKKSARLRDEERARLIWLLSTDKAVTSALLGKLTLAERYDEGTLADDPAEVEMLVSHLPPPDLADALEALPYDARTALWCLGARR